MSNTITHSQDQLNTGVGAADVLAAAAEVIDNAAPAIVEELGYLAILAEPAPAKTAEPILASIYSNIQGTIDDV